MARVGNIAVDTRRAPERYIRINIEKTAKAYRHETTVSLRWDGDDVDFRHQLEQLNEEADRLARQEIQRREEIDAFWDGAA